MLNFSANSVAEIYNCLGRVFKDGYHVEKSSPRGKQTLELIAPSITLEYPRNRIAYHKDRRFSSKYALIESLMLFDNSNMLRYFSYENANMAKFSDDGLTLYGSYGRRMADLIKPAIDKLKSDKDTRQAVLPILCVEDPYTKTKDVPCTISLQLLIRNNKLNMICNMRSNDIYLGMPYDIFMFTMMQEVIANELEIDIGWYVHRPASLHLYEENFGMFFDLYNNFGNIKITNNCVYSGWLKIKDSYKEIITLKKIQK